MKSKYLTKEEQKAILDSLYKPKLASYLKRIAAVILDVICVVILAVGIAYLFSILLNFDATKDALDAKYIQYGLKVYDESHKLVWVDLSSEEMSILYNAFEQDSEAVNLYGQLVDKTMIIPIIAASVSLLVFELIIPLCLKHGRTIGMYVSKIAMVTYDDIEVSFSNLFIRFLFGKLIICTLIPILCCLMIYFSMANIFILIILALIVIINIVLLFVNKRHAAIPDILGKVYVCELEGQLFFYDVEELKKAKKDKAKELNIKDVY